jgi:hypothetical protein
MRERLALQIGELLLAEVEGLPNFDGIVRSSFAVRSLLPFVSCLLSAIYSLLAVVDFAFCSLMSVVSCLLSATF